jgi:hypothetical protein
MQIIKGDLFLPNKAVSAIIITTNNIIKKNGEAVMGAGVALECKKRWPDIPFILAKQIITHKDKQVSHLKTVELNNTAIDIISFQTKTDWKLPSTMGLIVKSAHQLVEIADRMEWGTESVWLPPVGCGNGGLKWDSVRRALEPILDDRFTFVFKNQLID